MGRVSQKNRQTKKVVITTLEDQRFIQVTVLIPDSVTEEAIDVASTNLREVMLSTFREYNSEETDG
jgi:hypothetical protein